MNYPKFIKTPVFIENKGEKGKRYLLTAEFIDRKGKKDKLLVILKNPSKATKDISDQTINKVLCYIYHNMVNIGKVAIVNIYPFYKTDSDELHTLVNNKNNQDFIKKNIEIIKAQIQDHNEIIIAWGNSPTRLKNEYNKITDDILKSLKNKNVYHVDELNKTNPNHPLHGLKWECYYKSKKIKI